MLLFYFENIESMIKKFIGTLFDLDLLVTIPIDSFASGNEEVSSNISATIQSIY